MTHNSLVITEAGFLTEFLNQHTQRTDRPFCFILGAGASRASSIPTGGEMAQVWLRELYELENLERLSFEAWATPDRLGIEGFTVNEVANFYPQLYQRRYGDHEQAGYAFLESQMEGKEPSYGYSVLAYLLSETAHRVVITTNFDNLVADALSIHSSVFPLVIGHDALTRYAAVELRRPLVAKIHGALGFSPKSQPDEISQLSEGWQTALGRLLDRYTPIVIGYGGNDGSLMGFLQALPEHIPDRIYWCVRTGDGNATDLVKHVPAALQEYVRSRRGRFVPIRGFDELMAKLLTKLREKGSVPDLYRRLQERHRQREENYDDQQRRLFESAISSEPVTESKAVKSKSRSGDPALIEAVSEIAESRKDKPWWVWAQEVDEEDDPDIKERIFLQGIKALPNSADLHRKYAGFLERERDDFDKAQELYERALKIDPNHPITLGFYGDFLDRFRHNPDKAEHYLRRAFERRPHDDYIATRYATFLHTTRNEPDKAEELFERTLALHPDYDYILSRYAHFLRTVRKNVARAEELEQRLARLKKEAS